MELKFEAIVRKRKANDTFKKPIGIISKLELAKFAGKLVEVTVKEL